MKYAYYAVADRNKPEDFRWLTVFAVLDHMTCSLPNGKEGLMDTLHYVFKPLTKAQFDTHIAFESLEIKDSDDFSIVVAAEGREAVYKQFNQLVKAEDVVNKQK